MKNRKIFLMLLLILTLVVFTAACSTYNTPDVPKTTTDGVNDGYNNTNDGTGDRTDGVNDGYNNAIDGTTPDGLGGVNTTNGGVTQNTNQ